VPEITPELTFYVSYYIAQQIKSGYRRIESDGNNIVRPIFATSDADPILQAQTNVVEDFINARQPMAKIVATFTEKPESRRTNHWPKLREAIETCKREGATLLIAELGSLTNNEAFTQILLESEAKFHCCDQPFVNQTILEALFKHAEVQRKLHGKLIREGLKYTSAKSGNPNAAEVISKVNEPKINAAIQFAFIIMPIIGKFWKEGRSQRHMVKTLNEEGFTAPEGGKWVLSQLQKVLDRVRLNQVAQQLIPLLSELEAQELTAMQIAEALNQRQIAPLRRSSWDESQVKKLSERASQIKKIVALNRFVLDLLPLLHSFQNNGLNEQKILARLQEAGIPLRSPTANAA